MKLALFIPVIAASFGSAGLAAPIPGAATLAVAAVQPRVIGEGGTWRCDGNTCTGNADTSLGLAVATCTLVAKANGRVTGFVAGPTSFGEAELKRCNRHVK